MPRSPKVQPPPPPKRHAPPTPPPPPIFPARLTLRITEVTELTGWSDRTVRRLIEEGALRSMKIRDMRVIDANSLRELLGFTPT